MRIVCDDDDVGKTVLVLLLIKLAQLCYDFISQRYC